MKSIKLTGKELDSSGVVHNKRNLKEILEQGNLISDVTLTQHSSKMSLTNLNLEPGIYKIVICEYSIEGTSAGHVIMLNNVYGDYKTLINVNDGNWASDKSGAGLAFVNGWAKGTLLFYTEITLFYFNRDWVNTQSITNTDDLIIIQNGRCNFKVDKITDISIGTVGTDKIGIGSYMRLYKM